MLGSEARLLLDACPLAAIVLDPAGRIVFGNLPAREFFGPGVVLAGTRIADLLPGWPPRDPGGSPLTFAAGGGRERSCKVGVSSCPGSDGPLTTVWIEPVAPDPTAELAMRDAERRLRYVIEMLPQAVCVFDADDRYVLWNQRYAELYADIAEHLRPGIAFEEILKLSLASGGIQEVISDPDAWLEARMAKFRRPSSQEEHELRDGRWLRYDDRRTPDGGAIGLRIDITDLKQREEWLRQLFDANPMPMLLCDGHGLSILEANRAALRFYGFAEADLLSMKAGDMHVEDQRAEFALRLTDLDGHCEARTVWRQLTTDGRERHVLIYVRLLHKDAERRLLLTVADVTDRVLAEIEATRLANHDLLTGLPNRMQFYRALDDALRPDARERAVLYCLDLDGFKPVNDVFGHAVGDEVLQEVSARLRTEAAEHMVARLGGDEFAILARTGERIDTDLAARCIAALAAPFTIRNLPVSLGISIGIAAADSAGMDREALLQAADGALYRAKAAGRNTWRIAGDEERAPPLAKAG